MADMKSSNRSGITLYNSAIPSMVKPFCTMIPGRNLIKLPRYLDLEHNWSKNFLLFLPRSQTRWFQQSSNIYLFLSVMSRIVLRGIWYVNTHAIFSVDNTLQEKIHQLHWLRSARIVARLAYSLGAIHDSTEHCLPPNCHPDTCKAIWQNILDWIQNDSVVFPFFWLYRAPKVGKTVILQAITKFLCSPSGTNEIFGSSFFFSRGKNGHDQGHFLFSTLAYQLAPGLHQHTNCIIEENPELYTKLMAVQLQSLIIECF
jgi:hypothetical protein